MRKDQFDIIGELIESLGNKDFDGYFFRFYDEVLGIAHCTVFEFFGGEQARLVLAVGSTSDTGNSPTSLAYDYVNGFFHEDPYLLELMQVEKSEHPEWKKADPTKIVDEKYREKFYDEPQFTHELILPYKDDRHALIATLYRNSVQGAFTSREEKRASQYVNLSLKLLNKHIQLLTLRSERDGIPAVKPYFRVYDLLMQRYDLSPREAEICAMILVGYTTLGISLKLEISTNTVATHRKRAYRKLGIATQNELFCMCFEVM